MITNEQFDRTRRLALKLAGIELVERHRALLERRSQRVGILDTAGMEALLGAAEEGDRAATQRLLCLLTTKFTGFFRHPRHFEKAGECARRAVRERGHARLWSTAAATGEEPYSLAMALMEALGRDDPPVSILGTDIAMEALEAARRGEYEETVLRPIEAARRDRFFSRTAEPRRWGIAPAVRQLVELRTLNLASAAWAVEGPFDVIFCRNVLMYMEAGRRCTVLERLAALLGPDGLLMLDPTEHPGGAGHLFTAAGDGVYSLRGVSRGSWATPGKQTARTSDG